MLVEDISGWFCFRRWMAFWICFYTKSTTNQGMKRKSGKSACEMIETGYIRWFDGDSGTMLTFFPIVLKSLGNPPTTGIAFTNSKLLLGMDIRKTSWINSVWLENVTITIQIPAPCAMGNKSWKRGRTCWANSWGERVHRPRVCWFTSVKSKSIARTWTFFWRIWWMASWQLCLREVGVSWLSDWSGGWKDMRMRMRSACKWNRSFKQFN